MKECSKCHILKPLDDFYRHSEGKDGVRPDCKVCVRLRSLKNHLMNRDENNAKRLERQRANPDRHSIACKKYNKANKHKVNSLAAKKRASKLQRTPKWLTALQFDHIKLFYEAATQMTKELGIEFAVDHIIPLQGENVSGLHVPWNLQVLTRSENSIKGNLCKAL